MPVWFVLFLLGLASSLLSSCFAFPMFLYEKPESSILHNTTMYVRVAGYSLFSFLAAPAPLLNPAPVPAPRGPRVPFPPRYPPPRPPLIPDVLSKRGNLDGGWDSRTWIVVSRITCGQIEPLKLTHTSMVRQRLFHVILLVVVDVSEVLPVSTAHFPYPSSQRTHLLLARDAVANDLDGADLE